LASPLFKKLGIKPDQEVWTMNDPEEFGGLLAPLPSGASLRPVDPFEMPGEVFELCILFAQNQEELFPSFSILLPSIGAQSAIWFCWPKKSSGVRSDLSFDIVQKLGLSNGLVDNKICSINPVWSAIRFSVPLERRANWD